jgi:hypothetical protein
MVYKQSFARKLFIVLNALVLTSITVNRYCAIHSPFGCIVKLQYGGDGWRS